MCSSYSKSIDAYVSYTEKCGAKNAIASKWNYIITYTFTLEFAENNQFSSFDFFFHLDLFNQQYVTPKRETGKELSDSFCLSNNIFITYFNFTVFLFAFILAALSSFTKVWTSSSYSHLIRNENYLACVLSPKFWCITLNIVYNNWLKRYMDEWLDINSFARFQFSPVLDKEKIKILSFSFGFMCLQYLTHHVSSLLFIRKLWRRRKKNTSIDLGFPWNNVKRPCP